MASVTIREVLQQAVRIEESIRQFYLKAKEVLAGTNEKAETLLQKLADEEESHKKILTDTEVGRLEEAYLAYEPDSSPFQWDTEALIKPGMSPEEIQKLALERETYTRDFYAFYAKNITSKQVQEVFENLTNFEAQHIHKIKTEFGHYYG